MPALETDDGVCFKSLCLSACVSFCLSLSLSLLTRFSICLNIGPPSTLTGLLPQLPVVLDRNIAPLLKLKGGVHREFLPCRLPERLGPSNIPGITLPLEALVAPWPTKLEDLERDLINLTTWLVINYDF